MQYKNLGIVSLTAFLITILGVFGLQSVAKAANIDATQVLGQLDINGGPSFMQTKPDSSIVNNYGFDHAANMVVDSVHHRLFVSDTNNNRILVFNLPSQNIPVDFKLGDFQADYVLGQNNFSDNLPNQGLGSATDSSLRRPTGLAYYADANILYVVDRDNFRVVAYDVSTIDNGESAMSIIRAGSNSSLELYLPTGLALDSRNRRLFVSDSGRNRVLVYSLKDAKLPIAVLGQSDFTSAESGTTAANFDYPTGLAFNENNNTLYVADASNYRILVFNTDDGVDNGEDAVAVLGQPDFTSNNVDLNPPTAASFFGLANLVSSISFDPGTNLLYVPVSTQNRIMVFDVATIDNGEDAVYVLGQNNFSSTYQNQYGSVTAATLSEPTGVALANQYLYVADSENNRILIYDTYTLVNGQAAVSVMGQLDGNGVPLFTQNTINSATINSHGFNFGFPAYAGGITVDLANHRLFVADKDNNRVLVFNLDGSNNLVDYTADAVLGQADFLSGKFNRGGSVGPSTLSGPTAVTFDSVHNYLYVSDKLNSRVVVYDVADITNGENAIKVLGQANLNSNAQGHTGNRLTFPAGVALDTVGNILFVADSSNNRVLAFDVTDITDNEVAVHVLGQINLTDNASNHGANVDAIGMSFPTGLAFNQANKNLYVVDGFNNNRVLVFDTSHLADGQAATHVLGQANFTENFPNRVDGFSLPSANTLWQPMAVASDEASNSLYVSDSSNNRVLVYDLTNLEDGMAATAVLGQANPTALNLTGNGQAGFYNPNGLVRVNNMLYVIDTNNNRVMGFDVLFFSNTILPNGTVGSPYNKIINPAFNNRGALSYVVGAGNFPPGLALNPVTRVISGIPSAAGTFNFTITAKDTLPNGEFFTASKEFTIVVAASNGPANLNIISCAEGSVCADASTGSAILVPQMNNVQLGKWRFAAANSNVTLRKLTLQAVDPATNMPITTLGTFGTLSLYDGTTLLATGNYINSNVVFSNFNLVIPNGSSKTLTMKGNTNISGVFSSNKVVAFVVKSDSMVDIQAIDQVGNPLTSARINYNAVTSNGPAEFRFARATVYNFHDAVPVITGGILPSALTIDAEARIFKFSVRNSGTVNLKFSGVNVSSFISPLAEGGSITNFKLHEDIGGGQMQLLAQSNTTVGPATINPTQVPFSNINSFIAPGATKTFIVTANTTNMLTGLNGGSVSIVPQIAGLTGWNGTAWNTGNLLYYYTPLNGNEQGQFSASDWYPVEGNVLVYTI